MFRMWRVTPVVSIVLLGLFHVGTPPQAQAKDVDHRMIHLHPTGPRPEALTVKVGMPVVWQSHVAHTKRVVVTIAFLKGKALAQATQPVEGMNGFVLEGSHLPLRSSAAFCTICCMLWRRYKSPAPSLIWVISGGESITSDPAIQCGAFSASSRQIQSTSREDYWR